MLDRLHGILWLKIPIFDYCIAAFMMPLQVLAARLHPVLAVQLRQGLAVQLRQGLAVQLHRDSAVRLHKVSAVQLQDSGVPPTVASLPRQVEGLHPGNNNRNSSNNSSLGLQQG